MVISQKSTKPELIIHAGTYKTGSSAIQDFLSSHASALIQEGILYPLSSPNERTQRNHSDIEAAIARSLKYGRDEYMDSFTKRLTKDIDEHSPRLIIISAEGFWHKSESYIQHLCSHFKPFVSKIRMIIYLRNQIDLWISIYSQSAKVLLVDHRYPRWGDPGIAGREVSDHGMYFANVLDLFASIIGKENLIPRLYDRSCFEGRNIITDFLSLCQCRSISANASGKTSDVNSSWGWKGVEFSKYVRSSLLNNRIDALPSPVKAEHISALSKVVSSMAANNYPDWKGKLANYLSPSDQTDIYRHYRENNQDLSSRYFGGIEIFPPSEPRALTAKLLYDIPFVELKKSLETLEHFKKQSISMG